MMNRAKESDISTENIAKVEKAWLIQAFVFLYLLMFSSAETKFKCTVSRLRFGDRFVFHNYSGTCRQGVNPCKRVNAAWIYSDKNCSCRCDRSNSTYREDLGFCVQNQHIREECTLLFGIEQDTQSLRVFNNSSSIKLKTLPRESCLVSGTSYVIAYNGTNPVAWKQFRGVKQPFFIYHQDRSKDRHDHFLQWTGGPVAELFGKIVKVDVFCRRDRPRGSDTLSKMCIVFKVKGSVNLPCPAEPTSSPVTTATTIPRAPHSPGSNQTTAKPPVSFTDVVVVPIEPNATTDPPIIDNGNKESHNVDKKVALPIWLIGVVAGGAVIATLSITVIIWFCCKMKRRSKEKRHKSTTRRQLDNPLYQDEDVIAFPPWNGGTLTSEPGYARVGSPCGHSKGYAHLKQTPERCKSEYQKLLKPSVDRAGYLVPMEEVTTNARCPLEQPIYSEAESPTKPEPPPHRNKPKTKSKEYDYAKPEGIIVLTASRSNLDCLDSRKDTDPETDEGNYVDARDTESNGPSSPFYATVEGPNSPNFPGVSPKGALENELNDPPGDYIEVLLDNALTSPEVPPEGALLDNGLNNPPGGYIEVLTDTGNEKGFEV